MGRRARADRPSGPSRGAAFGRAWSRNREASCRSQEPSPPVPAQHSGGVSPWPSRARPSPTPPWPGGRRSRPAAPGPSSTSSPCSAPERVDDVEAYGRRVELDALLRRQREAGRGRPTGARLRSGPGAVRARPGAERRRAHAVHGQPRPHPVQLRPHQRGDAGRARAFGAARARRRPLGRAGPRRRPHRGRGRRWPGRCRRRAPRRRPGRCPRRAPPHRVHRRPR